MKKDTFILLLLALFWPLAIIPKEWFLVMSILLLGIALLKNPIIYYNSIFRFVSIIVSIHIVSIIWFSLTKNPDNSRIIAALNTAVSWEISGIVFSILNGNSSKPFSIDYKKYERILYYNIFIVVISSIAAVLFQKNGRIIRLFGNVLYFKEWILGEGSYRALLFFEYCSLITCFLLINLGLLMRNSISKKKLIVMALSALPIFLSKSRICILSFLIFAYGIVILCFQKRKNLNKKYLIILNCLLLLILFVFIDGSSIIYKIINSRINSSNTRFGIYSKSIETVMNINPLFGCGVKTMYSNEIVPLGSHCTYIGVLYKVGIIGTFFALLLLWDIIKRIKSTSNSVDFVLLISFFIIFALEDADGTNWLNFYIFVYLGLIKLEKSKNKLIQRCYL